MFLRPGEVSETTSDSRKVIVYIFSRHFMLRWYSQLRLSAEMYHYFVFSGQTALGEAMIHSTARDQTWIRSISTGKPVLKT